MRWKVYYVDGTTFGNEDGYPQDAPGGGVLAVVQENKDVGVETFYRCDFYCYDGRYSGWAGMDKFGLAQYIIQPGFKTIKMGEVMDTTKYREMIAKVKADPELPNKSAHYPREVIP